MRSERRFEGHPTRSLAPRWNRQVSVKGGSRRTNSRAVLPPVSRGKVPVIYFALNGW